jgi:hypothetical protein
LYLQLLKQVSNAEVKEEAAVKHELLEQQQALDMLPGSFEVLRSIYGERGPCVKPKPEVGAVRLLCHSPQSAGLLYPRTTP